uniref:Uncharacterized protein n=1 Tax=Acrobeloides nanus TaxID=290746 RepID=A0A914D6G8_9BILA
MDLVDLDGSMRIWQNLDRSGRILPDLARSEGSGRSSIWFDLDRSDRTWSELKDLGGSGGSKTDQDRTDLARSEDSSRI